MIRKALESDIESIYATDPFAETEGPRRDFIRRSVADGNCFVLIDDEGVAGYGVLNYTLHDCGFIDMLMVHADRRRQGFASELIRHMESLCLTDKLFTTTNESNTPMESLLTKLGYQPSGIIYNLDPGDPELVFFKQLR